MVSFLKVIIPLCISLGLTACINPFAPKLDTDLGSEGSLISDQKSIEGIFQNLQYAYTFKDTSIYGRLINSDFTFTYRDYEKEVELELNQIVNL